MESLPQSDCVRVIHLSSSHYPDDSRIFWKECRSLAQAGYDVAFVVAADRSLTREGVDIVAVKRPSTRLERMLVTPLRVLIAGLRRKGFIYHFHDPELLPAGFFLRALGKQVVYDVHEDLPRNVLYKEWLPRAFRRLASLASAAVEWVGGRTFSGVVAATPVIARRFPKKRTALVQNFASKSEFSLVNGVPHEERRAVAYVGGVTAHRGAVEMVKAIAMVHRFPDVNLLLAGPTYPSRFIDELTALPGWSRVDYRGLLDRVGVQRLLAESRVGLVVVHPLQSHIDMQPVKLYEYMAAGIPVISSDFPRFRDIVEGNRCGLCVPPRDVAGIATAIEWIFEHPAEAAEMGKRGRELIMQSLNWQHEEQELLRFYQHLVGDFRGQGP
jgi:glycosyltransferase involved in cell wall biosynthesis